MSQLDKLAIRGIRSFDPGELAVMQFYTPLTVIVGHNGSGKTTIIECLKYATTGDLPPNTKGGAFVHDPTIAGEQEVKAEVRLRFRNAQKQKLVLTRKLQVTKKKTAGLTMKTLEGTLTFAGDKDDDKSRRTLSTKCAEMDEEVPRQLGVSKAILENVIFCHQEDSNWPLAEPAALKKKFDDIFEATKYTKALDQIKSIRKEQTAGLKVDKERLSALKNDRTRAKKIQGIIDTNTVNIQDKTREVSDLNEQIQTLYTQNQRFYQQATKHAEIINTANSLEDRISATTDQINSIRETINMLQDSDAELQGKLNNFQEHVDAHQGRLNDQYKQRDSQEASIQQTSASLNSQHSLMGKFKAESERYERNLADRQNLVVQLAGQHNIAGYEMTPMEDEKVNEFVHQLSVAARKADSELNEIKNTRSKEENAKQSAISGLKAKEASSAENRRNIKSQISTHQSGINNYTSKIDNCRVTEAELKYSEESLADNKKRLAHMKQELEAASYDAKIRAKAAESRELEVQRDNLQKELASLNKQNETRAKLGVIRADKEKKEQALQSGIDRNAAKHRKLIGTEPTADAMEADITSALKEKETELVGAERALQTSGRESQSIEAKVNFAKSQLAKLKKQAADHEAKVSEATEGRDLKDCFAEAEDEFEIRKRELDTINYAVGFYSKSLAYGKERKCCTTCQRDMDPGQLMAFERFLTDQIKNAPKRKIELTEEFEGWKDELEKLRSVQINESAAQKLRSEDIPQVEQEFETASAKMEGSTAAKQEAIGRTEALKAEIRDMNLLKRAAIDITRHAEDLKNMANSIRSIEGELAITGSIATVEDVNMQLAELNKSLRTLNQESQTLAADKEQKRNGVHLLESNISKTELELSNSRSALKERKAWEARRDELRKDIDQAQEQLKVLDQSARDSAAPIRKLEDELAALRKDFDSQERDAARQLNGINRSTEKLERSSAEIDQYRRGEGAEKMHRCSQKIKDYEHELSSKGKILREVKNKISVLEREAAETEQLKRNILDNIRLRDQERKKQSLAAQLEELDVPGAEKAKRKFDTEYEKVRQEQTRLQAKQDRLAGELESTKAANKERAEEIETEYKDIKKRYRDQLVKVKVSELSNEDLEKYGKALDSAILKYHEHKMREINDSIQGLWNKTYQGTDIDKILLKSDTDGVKAGGRSYNYRVVMMKDSVEMDMRGRCSAGQKVLASIIIRLALAESFGTNCGILALDEPTTNLDRDNIHSLAIALNDIIEERRGQTNFQLIIITHDEDLLSELSKSDSIERYWRVARDHRQRSVIERQRIDQLE